MILERLTEFRPRIAGGIVPSYHKRQDVSWILSVDEDGQFLGFVEAESPVDAPYMRRTGSKPPPYLLVDKPEYVLGLPRSESDKHQESAAWRHDAYVELVAECAEASESPAIDAFLTFLRERVADALADPRVEDMKTGDLIAPRVGDTFLTDSDAVRSFWIETQDREAEEKSELEAECMICGEMRPIARTHPVELQLGPDRVGLITGNADAFLSYGLEQSEIAPVCQVCARTYGEALRYLLQSDAHRLCLSGTTWVFWTREETSMSIVPLLSDADEGEVRNLLNSVKGSAPQPTDDPNAFYALSLSANISRLAVRGWLDTTVAEAEEKLAAYFHRQRLLGRDGEARYHNVFALAGSLVRDLGDLPPQVLPQLLGHALEGKPLPVSLLTCAVRRARVDDYAVTAPRAALIKLVLLSQPDTDVMVEEQLTEGHPSPAYQCGRLLAELEYIEYRAINPNATLVDRYYGTASTAPASVFGRLLGNAQNHLAKLRKNKKGMYVNCQKRLGAITGELDPEAGFPRTLSAEEQGLFALGYYQHKNRSIGEDVGVEQAEDTEETVAA